MPRVTLHSSNKVGRARRHLLHVPSIRRSTIGDRAFPVAAACACNWNSLHAVERQDFLVIERVPGRPQTCSRHHLNDRTILLPLSLTTDTSLVL